jgi:hypothetical protein
MLKAKLALLAFCLAAVAGSQLYLSDFDEGIASVDREAFDSYTHFAREMRSEQAHAEIHRPTRRRVERDRTVWAVLNEEGK